MGEITEKRMRHYVGADADKDLIPAAALDPGDSYHGNDSKKQYYWNGVAWKTGLGYEYVPLTPNAYDKVVGDFTTDGTWKVDGLDLSGIVPAGAVAVVLALNVVDDAADSYIQIRTDAAAARSLFAVYTQVANISMFANGVLPISADRLLDYTGANVAFAAINLAVLGYFI